tara:strand:+ start:332 stop:496 length:165 start_codon:yes stop_codon:yes gene_type:complete
MAYYTYTIKLNTKPYPVFNVTETSEKLAFKTILGHEINYNPNWGYKLIKKERII